MENRLCLNSKPEFVYPGLNITQYNRKSGEVEPTKPPYRMCSWGSSCGKILDKDKHYCSEFWFECNEELWQKIKDINWIKYAEQFSTGQRSGGRANQRLTPWRIVQKLEVEYGE